MQTIKSVLDAGQAQLPAEEQFRKRAADFHMRVHHITNNYSMFSGGAERVVRTLHAGLVKRNVESHIFGLTQPSDQTLAAARSLELDDPYDVRAIRGINRYLKEYARPGDIVQVHLFPALLYVSILKKLRYLPYCLVGTEHSTSNRRRNTVPGRLIDRFTYAGYDHIVAISEGVRSELISWKPGLAEKTRVIFNGVTLPFEQMIERQPNARPRILSIGNLRTAKNYDSSLKALALLKDRDFQYDIAGEGECRESLQQSCRRLGLASNVRFLGFVRSVPDLLAAADIFLMPSRWEGFGLAAVEAMNAGLPLVVSDIPGLRELVDTEPPCALLVDPESPQSIANALRCLLDRPQLRSELGANAFHRASVFSDACMVNNYLEFYREIA